MSAEVEAELSHVLQFLYACPVGLVDFGSDGTIGMMNPMAMQLLMPLASAATVTNFFSALESCGPDLRNLAAAFAAPRGTVCENRRLVVSAGCIHGGAEPTILSCTVTKLAGERFLATLSDVSRQVAQERRLKQAEIWFASLLDGAEDFAVLSLDDHGRIEAVNSSVFRHTGLEASDVLGRTLDVFDAPDPDHARLNGAEQIALAKRDGWHLDEGWQRHHDGGRRWCQRLIVVRGEDEGDEGRIVLGYTAVLRLVTRQDFDTAKLRRMLRTDFLTGVCNRARFFEIAERETLRSARHGEPLAVITLDVDHFKRINDGFGHAVGDEVLKAVASACASVVRREDTFARLGGEEFAVFLPSTDLATARELAERLRCTIADLALPQDERVIKVTASFGCAVRISPGISFAQLLAQADSALYEAKRSGRNCIALARTARAVA